MNLLALWIALGVLFLGLVLVAIVSVRKKAWYKVYLANNDIRLMQRSWGERWRSTEKYPKFKDDNGNEFTFPSEAHWVLMWEHIPNSEVVRVREELVRRVEQKRKGEEE